MSCSTGPYGKLLFFKSNILMKDLSGGELALKKGYEPLEGYADKSHVCYSAQKFLRSYYPNILEISNIWD
ncbi:MAG: hypothetical protein ACFFB0_04505 [Promethearchaeota archaeon]